MRQFILCTFFGILLLSCVTDKAKCNKYVGRWVSPNQGMMGNSNWIFNISKDNGAYLFEAQSMDGGLGTGYKTVLSCENGELLMRGVPMMGDMPLSIVGNGNTLFFAGDTYTRRETGTVITK